MTLTALLPALHCPALHSSQLIEIPILQPQTVFGTFKAACMNDDKPLKKQCEDFVADQFQLSLTLGFEEGRIALRIHEGFPSDREPLAQFLRSINGEIHVSSQCDNPYIIEALMQVAPYIDIVSFAQTQGRLSSCLGFLNCCTNLKKIALTHVLLDGGQLRYLKSHAAVLVLDQCFDYTAEDIAESSLPLTSLAITDTVVPHWHNQGVIALLKSKSAIQSLRLKRCRQLSVNAFMPIPNTIFRLTSLDLSRTLLGDSGFEAICNSLQALVELAVNHTFITSNGLIPLKQMTSLKKLKLKGTKLQDFAMSFVAFTGNRLEYINIEKIHAISNWGVWKLVMGCPQLEVVDVATGNRIHDMVRQAVSTFQPCEPDLILSMDTCLTRMAFEVIFKRYRYLQRLTLRNCLQGAPLNELMKCIRPQNQPHLRQIELQTTLTKDALKPFFEACSKWPGLQVNMLN